MKITFRGWQREVYTHEVEVTPVVYDSSLYRTIEHRRSLAWSDGMTAFGKLDDLSLNGAFLAEFKFTETELKSWLTRYLITKPADALGLIADAQADAIQKLSMHGRGN